MAWPDLSQRGILAPDLRNELEQAFALTQGLLAAEHNAAGGHTVITVDGIQFRNRAGIVIATITIVDGQIVISYTPQPTPAPPAQPPPEPTIVLPPAQISDVLVGHHHGVPGGTFAMHAGIDLNTDSPPDGGGKWLVGVGVDAFSGAVNGALVFANYNAQGQIGEGIALYLSAALGPGYALCPPAAGSLLQYRLGSRLDSRLLWDQINGKLVYGRDGFQEHGRTVALGEWIDVPFNAANFTGAGGMVVTVQAADQASFTYTLIGQTAILIIALGAISLAAPMSQIIRIQLPFTAARTTLGPVGYLFDGTFVSGVFDIGAGSSVLQVYRLDQAVLTPSVNNTYLNGQITIPI